MAGVTAGAAAGVSLCRGPGGCWFSPGSLSESLGPVCAWSRSEKLPGALGVADQLVSSLPPVSSAQMGFLCILMAVKRQDGLVTSECNSKDRLKLDMHRSSFYSCFEQLEVSWSSETSTKPSVLPLPMIHSFKNVSENQPYSS